MSKKRVIYIFIILVIIMLGIVGGFFGYLQLSLFDVNPIQKSAMANYISKQGMDILEPIKDTLYECKIPNQIVNDQLTYSLIQQEKTDKIEIVSANVFGYEGYANVNYLIGSIYVPVYYELSITSFEDGFIYTLNPQSYGNKHLNLPDFFDQLFFKSIFNHSIELQLSISDYNSTELFKHTDISLSSDGIKAMFILEFPDLDSLVKDIQSDIKEEYIQIYENGSETQKEALTWIRNYDEDKEHITNLIYEDYLGKRTIIEEVLALVTPATLMKVYEKFPKTNDVLKKDLILSKRTTLIGDSVLGYGQIILEALKSLSQEGNLIVAKEYPFNYKTMTGVTIDTLVKDYQLEIDQSILDSMTMSYVNGIVYIVYASEEGPYIAIDLTGFKTITEQDFTNIYNRPVPSEGKLTEDVPVYEDLYFALYTYYGEDLFIRYLKNDDQEAYGIVSLESDYQNFKIVVLRKTVDQFQVIGDGYGSALEVNKAFPDFNMNLATRMNEGTSILLLNSTTQKNLISRLQEYGYMEEGEELIYCSYDGVRYIAIELNSGEQYIQTIYRGAFLGDVYTFDEAINLFDDIDPLILLQANPNKDVLNE